MPVRLDPEEKRQLQEIADKLGSNVSALIRGLLRAFVADYERGDGRVTMPPDWHRILGPDFGVDCKAAEKPITYSTRRPRKESGEKMAE